MFCVSLPRLTWITKPERDEYMVDSPARITNDSGITIVCPEKKPVFPIDDILCMVRLLETICRVVLNI